MTAVSDEAGLSFLPSLRESGKIFILRKTNFFQSLIQFAPAESGNIDIVNHGDGSYDISFECTDDRGNVWSGSWSGEISILDTGYSSAAASSAKTATLSHGVSISSVTAAGRETAGAVSPYALKVKKPAGGTAAPVRRTVE